MVYRGSIARRLIWLSTLRRGSYPPATQDSLPAAGPALPDGIGYPQGSLRKVSSVKLSCVGGVPGSEAGPWCGDGGGRPKRGGRGVGNVAIDSPEAHCWAA